jgi:hypothetical protein
MWVIWQQRMHRVNFLLATSLKVDDRFNQA